MAKSGYLSPLSSDEFRKRIAETVRKAFERLEWDQGPPDRPGMLGLHTSEPPVAVPPQPPDLALASMMPHPCVVLILGHRGGGNPPWPVGCKS